jgi:lysophospholipase L1-like esterase
MEYIYNRLHMGGSYNFTSLAMQDRRELFHLLPHVPNQIVFLGDSLTANGPWVEMFPGMPIANRGVGFSSIQDGYGTVVEGAIAADAKKVFLQFGNVDMVKYQDTQTFIDRYRKLIELVKTTAPAARIYVQSLAPWRWIKGDVSSPARWSSVNDQLRILSRHEKATYVDIYDALDQDAEQGLPDAFTLDSIHLSTAGYQAWLEQIRPFVQE